MNQDLSSRHDTSHEVETILEKAEQHAALSESEMRRILKLREGREAQEVFRTARELRDRYFGNRVFLYGFLYFSTFCDNNCDFCFFRKNNSAAVRYRKSTDQIVESARSLSESGVHLIDLTMGEDPQILRAGRQGAELLLQTVRAVRRNTNLPVMISAGVLPEPVLRELPEAGAVWYACYQETHNRTLYNKLRTGQDYHARLDSKRTAKERGLLIEEGLLVGAGESAADIARSISVMRELGADQVRAMTFVPQKGTPMEHFPTPDPLKELLAIALMRLVFPQSLIPASLDVGGHAQLHRKLAAGANVITSLIPPDRGLAGVAQYDSNIENGKRTVVGIRSVLRKSGLEPASRQQYLSWVNRRLQSSLPVCTADAT